MEELAKPAAVNFAHVHEMRAAAERGLAGEVHVVRDHHPRAGLEIRVHGSGRIGEDQRADSDPVHEGHRSRDLRCRPALVEMDASQCDEKQAAIQTRDDKASGVTRDG